LITLGISKNLLVKSTYFKHKDIHKYTRVSPDGKTLNQVDHVLCIASRESKLSKQLKYEVKRLHNSSIKANYRLELSNRFEILADCSSNNDDINNDIDVRMMWVAIRETINSAAKEHVGEKKQQKNKSQFEEECLKLREERKQVRHRSLSNKSEANTNHYTNSKRNTTLGFRKKARISNAEDSGDRGNREDK